VTLSSYNEILIDQNIDAVLIATRHDLHAQLVIEGMKQGKAVFVEKPLALSQEELAQVIEVQRETGGQVMVGFNRRFSPLAVKVNQFFADRKGPLCIVYRVNAGFIPKDHWIQDEKQGGGRIIGEVCHFVDFMQYLTDSAPQTVFAQTVCDATGALIPHDNVMITLQFENGSIGTISYLSNGDVAYGKERVEIFGDGAVALIDDFNRAEISHKGKRQKFGGNFGASQKKGHREELAAFVEAIRKGKPLPISFEESVITTETTFTVIESIRCQMIFKMDIR
jgi:polar amino acid transport system substrate-binding protein